MSKHGTVHWSELMTGDIEASKAYYASVCGWQFTEMPMPDGMYYIAMKGETPIAGLMAATSESTGVQVPQWMTYLAVDDVDAAVNYTVKNGGSVLHDCMDIPGVGRIAMIKDPGGASLGIMTPADNS